MKKVLYLQYINLIEEAYNLNQADHAQSDIASFEADKILEQINALEFTSETRLA
nr:Lacal_2735 family protein [Winogradskyella alexanderae]